MKYLTFTLLLLLVTTLYSEESTSTSISGGDYIMTSVGSGGGNSGHLNTTTILNIKTQEVFVINSSGKTPSFYRKKLVDFEIREKN